MNILIIRQAANKLNSGTYNLQELGLAKALVEKGHKCDVAYYCGKESDHWEEVTFGENKKVRILWIHGWNFLKEAIYPSLKKYVNDYDVIQIGGYTGITACWLNRNFQNKVVNYQGPYYCKENKGDIIKANIFDRVLLPLCSKSNMMVLTKSKLATEYMTKKGIRDVTTVGVGIDLDNLIGDNLGCEENEFVRNLVADKNDDKYLLYIGALEERRNIMFLLNVFKKVTQSNDKVKLVIIGKGEKKYVESVFNKIDELNLKHKIVYLDRLEQKFLKFVYENSDIFLLPTKYEIFGMVLLEAMYFGMPVITTYNGGSSTLLTSDNGVIIDEFDVDRWSSKVMEILDDEHKRISMGNNARDTIINGFTWDVVADKFVESYERRLAK